MQPTQGGRTSSDLSNVHGVGLLKRVRAERTRLREAGVIDNDELGVYFDSTAGVGECAGAARNTTPRWRRRVPGPSGPAKVKVAADSADCTGAETGSAVLAFDTTEVC